MMKRPSVGDRWQNRRTSRVCVVEGIKDHADPRIARVGYRYEQETAAGNRRRIWTSVAWFNATFAEFEKVTP